MNRGDAIAAIEASFAQGSHTPCPRADDRAAYIRQQQGELLACVIEPVPAVVSAECHAHGLLQALAEEPGFAIARAGDHWLLCQPARGVFCLAFGEEPTALTALGFCSRDALAEWLG